VNDRAYRDGRSFANSRDRRAAAKKTRYGRSVLRRDWPDNEFETLERLANAGVTVPLPVARTADGVLMQYIGDRKMAAPRLVTAGLRGSSLQRAASQLIENLRRMVEAGVVHADLSAFNMLWWDDLLWIIDVPQAVDISTNRQAIDFLHRDVQSVGTWFRAKDVAFDSEDLFTELVTAAFGSR
jgi:RIO kinase 1